MYTFPNNSNLDKLRNDKIFYNCIRNFIQLRQCIDYVNKIELT